MWNTLAKKTNRSPSGNVALRRPKVASTEMSDLLKENRFHRITCGMRTSKHQSARSVSWADVSSRKQNKNVRGPLERQVHGRHYPQRSVDVEKVRTLIWCRKCAAWASENRLGKRLRNVCKLGHARWSYQL